MTEAEKNKCKHCSYTWTPRVNNGKLCPGCRRPDWADGKETIVPICVCEKCGWDWTPRIPDPKLCPSCRTAYWKKGNRDEQGNIIH